MDKDDNEQISALKATRLLAMLSVDKKDPDYVYRFIMRWYSREFATPLHEVEELPVEDVLLHFFECRYEGMEDHDLDEEIEDLCMSDAQRVAKEEEKRVAAEADDAFEREIAAEAAAAEAKNPSTPAKMPDQNDPPPIPVAVMGENLPSTFKDLVDREGKDLKQIPQDIKMVFVDDQEMDDLTSFDLLGPPRKTEK
jgi:hypothetical protein